MQQTKESRYLLNDYITKERKVISVRGIEYEVQLFQGDHSNEYLLSEMKDGKVEGRCQLFNCGILTLAWMMKDGKRIGGVTEYENGIALKKENWDSILGKGDRRMIENGKEGLIMTIQCKCENGEDESDDNAVVIYRGGFDEEMNRNGYGIEYDRETGKEKLEGCWEKDKLIRIVREFDPKNNKMIEYAENNNNTDLLNRIPIYMGGYCVVKGEYVRNGIGYLFDDKTGAAIHKSEWKCGVEKYGGVDLYDGWYVKGISESIRCVLNNVDPRDWNTISKVDVSANILEISSSSQLSNLSLDVTDLVINSNSCTELYSLDLRKFKWLESIEIGDECFGSVKTFKIDGLNRLKTIKIGNNSFTQKRNSNGNDLSKSFHILNCESLESIQIGEYSFSDFGGEFELKNLPQLQSIQIGTIGSESRNFCFSSFVIRGIDMILNI